MNSEKLYTVLFPLFDEFLFTDQWNSGVNLFLQIFSNLGDLKILSRFDYDKTQECGKCFEKVGFKSARFLAALIYNSHKNATTLKIEENCLEVYLWFILSASKCENLDGWDGILFDYLIQSHRKILNGMINRENLKKYPDEFVALIEFVTEKVKKVSIDEGKSEIIEESSLLRSDTMAELKEIFFDLCNDLLIVRKDKNLPFGKGSLYKNRPWPS